VLLGWSNTNFICRSSNCDDTVKKFLILEKTMLAVMNVPPNETSPQGRVLAKVENLLGAVNEEKVTNGTQIQGELYECYCAYKLIKSALLRTGNEIGRWDYYYKTGGEQSLYPVMNREKDFFFRKENQRQKNILGEAKSYSAGIGGYIKDNAQMCLIDLKDIDQPAGFLLITPGDSYLTFLKCVYNVYEFVKTDGQAKIKYSDAKNEIEARYPGLKESNYLEKFQNRAEKLAPVPVLPPTTKISQRERIIIKQLPYELNENRQLVAHFLNLEMKSLIGIMVAAKRVPLENKSILKVIWKEFKQICPDTAQLQEEEVNTIVNTKL
jgi:hypothetical protein